MTRYSLFAALGIGLVLYGVYSLVGAMADILSGDGVPGLSEVLAKKSPSAPADWLADWHDVIRPLPIAGHLSL